MLNPASFNHLFLNKYPLSAGNPLIRQQSFPVITSFQLWIKASLWAMFFKISESHAAYYKSEVINMELKNLRQEYFIQGASAFPFLLDFSGGLSYETRNFDLPSSPDRRI